jgi:hypothetical protein
VRNVLPNPIGLDGDARRDWHRRWLAEVSSGRDAAPRRPESSVGHPSFAESLIPVWGSGREAVADFQEGDYAGAALNGALAASDLFLAGSLAKGVAKGAFYGAGKGAGKGAYSWSNKVRPWMKAKGYLQPYQHGHHWAVPQNGWGKNVPEWFKNQPWNIKAMPEGPAGAEMHGRLTGSYKGKPRFNALERYWYGTPAWSKVGTGAAVGHPTAAAKAQVDKR